MQLTERVRIYPTPEQENVLWCLSEQCRLIYNFALAERRKEWMLNNLRADFGVVPWGKQYYSVDYKKQQNDLPKTKEKYPSYKIVYSKVLQMAIRTLNHDYKSFFELRRNGDTNAHPPGFKGKDHFTTMMYNQSGFTIKGQEISLSHFYNEVPLVFELLRKYNKVYQVNVYQTDRKYYLGIVHEVPEKPYVDNGLYQAIDLGVTKTVTAINTESKFYEAANPRPDQYWNPKVDELQARRDHCIKGSQHWHRLNRAKNKLTHKCSNQIKDIQHKLTRKMVNNTKANTIIVGDLDVKEMAQSKSTKISKKAQKSLNRSTQNNGYLSQFVGFLTYKAALIGKKVIEIDERYTSKKCYVCGMKHDMPILKRTMECDCGNMIDRDRNSAIFIMLRFLSQNAMWTGYQQFVGNLRQTGLMMPKQAPSAYS